MRILYVLLLYSLILLVKLQELFSFLFSTITKGYTLLATKVSQKIRFLVRSVTSLLHFLFAPFHSFFQGIKKKLIKSSKKDQALHVRKVRHRRPPHHILFSFGLKLKYFLIGVIFSFIVLFLPLLTLIFLQELPNPQELTSRQIPQTTKIFDRHGALLYEIYASQNRTLVHLSDVPVYLQQATLAIEDKNFYKHPGFDLASIIRALKENLSGGNIQGGSTITQQLIKSSMLTTERNISRKIKEIVLAFWAERLYTKKQILEMYFNQVPYGGTAWGIEAASEVYFGKKVKELDLAESAFLAGLTQAPSQYSPYSANPHLWEKRQKEVLSRMVALGNITKKQAEKAEKERLHFKKPQVAMRAPHFVEYVKNLLVQKYGLATVEKGGLQVTTSLDLKTQDMAQQVVSEEVENDAYLNLTNGAALVTNPKNGDILAMVGSRDFSNDQFGKVNITTSLRQPGSSIKIVTYSAALAHGFTAASIFDDTATSFPILGAAPYTPVNYDGKFHGKVPLRIALANSLNIPAVKALDKVGIPTVVDLGKSMGITSWGDPSEYGLSLTLGAAEVTMLDMARVNGTLANGGKRVDLNPILKITDYRNNTIEQKQQPDSIHVLSDGVAFILSNILADNQARSMEFGSNSPLNIPGHYVSVKTGTSDDKRDNWTNGYTDNFVVIVWVGNNDNSPMSQDLASGITGAAPIWNKIMTNLLTVHHEDRLRPPADITKRSCYGHDEFFLKGTENTVSCGSFPATALSSQQRAKKEAVKADQQPGKQQ